MPFSTPSKESIPLSDICASFLFDGHQEMQFRPLFQFFLDLAGREALVRDDNPFRMSLSRMKAG